MKNLALLTLFSFMLISCGLAGKKNSSNNDSTLIRADYKKGEITKLTDLALTKLTNQINDILKISNKDKNFSNTIYTFETVTSEFSDSVGLLGFMNAVATDKDLRDEALTSEMKVNEYFVNLGTRRDIYDALVVALKNTPKNKLNAIDKKLADESIKSYKRSGLFLPDDKLLEVKNMQQQLAKMTSTFANNIKESIPVVELTVEQLNGVPADYLEDLKKSNTLPSGKLKIKINSSSYSTIMENCTVSDTRKIILEAYDNKAAEVNTPLLVEIITLRQNLAKKLNYKTWADYKTENRMAKNGKTAFDFLMGLKAKLAVRNKLDMDAMLKFKKTIEPKTTALYAWDTRFLDYQMKKTIYALDNEKIKEYFPANETVKNMFKIYSELFGVTFHQIENATVWAPEVKLYQIRNTSDNSLVAHFYTDFVPREGKYGHFAAFGVLSGRLINGEYVKPTSVIVGNFAPPLNNSPSLLTFDEVETLFHEFGHIMHQTLTKAPYSALAGSSVARDFVEAPSQMLENWIWNKEMLKIISGHYKNNSEKLPDAIINQMLASKNFNKGFFNTRQLLFGIFDMTLHSATAPVKDPTAIYKKLYKEIAGLDPLPNTHFPAGFGHLMHYDAGYYGYLWSLVYADDMFTEFEKKGLLNSEVGMRYRKTILEKGSTEEASALLTQFMKRKPNNKAFLNKLFGK